MINQELLPTDISGHGNFLRYSLVLIIEVVYKFLPRKLHSVEAIGHVGEPIPIPRFVVEVVPLLPYGLLLLSSKTFRILPLYTYTLYHWTYIPTTYGLHS